MGVDKLPRKFEYKISAQSENARTTYRFSKGAKVIIEAEQMSLYTIKPLDSKYKRFLETGEMTTTATAQKKIVDAYVQMEGRFLFVRCEDDILRGDQHGKVFTSTYQFSEGRDDEDREEYELQIFNKTQVKLEARINNRSYREFLPLSQLIDLIKSAKDDIVTESIRGIPITICYKGPLLFYADFGDSVLPF